MEEITFQVQRDEQLGLLTARWDDSDGAGGITTQGQDLRDLQEQITEAVRVARVSYTLQDMLFVFVLTRA